jgi:hypothetical protein
MKIKQTQEVYLVPDPDSPTGYRIELVPEVYSWYVHSDSIKLSTFEQTFEVDVPDTQELAKLAISTLKERQEKIMAKAEKDRVEIQAKIDTLLQLGHTA